MPSSGLSSARRVSRCRTLLAMLFITASLPAVSFAAENENPEPAVEQSWQVLLIGGQRIGYAQSTSRERTVDGKTVHESDALTHMKISRFGQTLEMKQMLHLVESDDGRLLKFTSVIDNPPNSRITASGRVEGDRLTLTNVAAGTERTSVLTGMQGVLSPSWPERSIAARPLQEGEERTFEVFDPQLGKKSTVSLKGKSRTTTKLLDGREVPVGHVEMTQSIPGLPKIVMDLYLNESNEMVKLTTPLLGIEAYDVTEEEAKKELGSGEVDLAVGTLVKVKPIAAPHEAKRITYHVRVEGTDPRELFASGPTQELEVIDDRQVRLTVRAIRPGETKPNGAGAPPGEEFVRATRYLESDAPEIRALAARAAEPDREPAAVAVALEKFVNELVEEKDFSTSMATALETARSRTGDCTEHAVLLAALLRAKSIPSRVAIGFVYSAQHSAFVGHMWTEAWLGGRWVPLDATLARGGIGAGHIKVADSSLADAGNAPVAEFLPLIHILGRTTIEVLDRE